MKLVASLHAGGPAIETCAALGRRGADLRLVVGYERDRPQIEEVLRDHAGSRLLSREESKRARGFTASGPVGDEVFASGARLLAAVAIADRSNWNQANVSDLFRLYMRLCAYWESQLRPLGADVCWFAGIPHQTQDWALYDTCGRLGVRTVFTTPSIFDHSPVTYIDPFGAPAPVTRQEDADRRAQSMYLDKRVGELVDPERLEQSRGFAEFRAKVASKLSTTLRSAAGRLRNDYPVVIPAWPARGFHKTTSGLLDRWRVSATAKRLLSLPSEIPDAQQPWIYFPLHFQPEMTSVPIGLPHFDQVSAVRAIAGAVAGRARVLVKEHPQMLRWGPEWGRGRSASFYEELESIPGVELVNPHIDSDALARGARCVATLTGTVAYQARHFGVPGICFGAPWYQSLRGIFRVRSSADLQNTVDRCLGGEKFPPLSAAEVQDFVDGFTLPGAFAAPTPENPNPPERFAAGLWPLLAGEP